MVCIRFKKQTYDETDTCAVRAMAHFEVNGSFVIKTKEAKVLRLARLQKMAFFGLIFKMT